VVRDSGGKIGSVAPPSTLSLYSKALFNPVGSGAHPQGVVGGAEQVGGRAMQTLLSPVMHPLDTLKGIGGTIREVAQDAPQSPLYNPTAEAEHPGPLMQMGKGYAADWKKSPALAMENAAGDVAGTVEGGRMLGGAVEHGAPAIQAAANGVREAAMGNPDLPALRVMKEPPSSTSAIRSLGSVEGARPFLKGTGSIAEAQTRIPAAKAEIMGEGSQYQQAINEIGERPVKGPDGMTTVRALEEERKQLSAMNRGLKTGDPAALQLAEQKGLNQASALDREEAVKAALDPQLQSVGIKPTEIRKAFAQVSDVGSNVMGRTTLAEHSPSGFGRMANVRLTSPRTWLGQPAQGIRDVVAGRPLWTAQPSDVAMREAFRSGGEKPDFGQVIPQNRLKLPAEVPAREGDFGGEWQFGVPNRPTVTPAPLRMNALPAAASEGEAQPMLMTRAPFHPGVASEFSSERPAPTQFRAPEILPPEMRIAGPEGIRTAPRGLLSPGAPEHLPESAVRIHPPGSAHGIFDEDLYPRGSKFGRKH
jgi:hypothetical protein